MPGATLIPLDQLSARLSEVPRDREIVVVCRSGNRSQQGRAILLQAGFSQVTSMAGGYANGPPWACQPSAGRERPSNLTEIACSFSPATARRGCAYVDKIRSKGDITHW